MKSLSQGISRDCASLNCPSPQVAGRGIRWLYLTDMAFTSLYLGVDDLADIDPMVRLIGVEKIALLDLMRRKTFTPMFRIVHMSARCRYRINRRSYYITSELIRELRKIHASSKGVDSLFPI